MSACGTGDTPVSAATAVDSATLLAAWMARSVPSGAQVSAADASTLTLVAGAGVTATVSAPVASAGGVDRYLISAAPSQGVGVRGVAAGVVALPVAGFGEGTSAVLVELLVAGSAGSAADAIAQDASRRVAAGTGLLANPAVTACEPCRAVLAAGGLDLRASSLVAVLAAQGAVAVRAIVADPAETLAGRPARTITLDTAAPGAVRAIAAATVGGYRPTITAVRGTTTSLTWNLADTTTLTGV